MIVIVVISIILVLIDQISKKIIELNYNIGDSKEIIKNFFYITSHRNRGAAWGILQNSRYLFLFITILFLFLLFFYIYKNKVLLKINDYVMFSLIIGGALGNFLDRIIKGEVIDFLDFHIFGYDFPIFNLADTFICLGIFLLALKIYKE
ncbi:signal peptidase II [Gemelliphila asaccharolytica]|uniref:Lipoprotein signal peptidase n=1 Tax=Gemelliphila asaccharolytica TaxID=502393 RepID=A0ABR5TMM9_9BACL|nr:signal peptidase II [Gemella asaccharolytica]KXB58581.1 signal peptidase II [Gemella asaccharolytica]